MNKWAVIQTGGKQYKVSVGDTVIVEKLEGAQDSPVVFDRVLAVAADNLTLGFPLIEKAKVEGKILSTFKANKIRVVKFKSKSRYLRTQGHRQTKTKVSIEKI